MVFTKVIIGLALTAPPPGHILSALIQVSFSFLQVIKGNEDPKEMPHMPQKPQYPGGNAVCSDAN